MLTPPTPLENSIVIIFFNPSFQDLFFPQMVLAYLEVYTSLSVRVLILSQDIKQCFECVLCYFPRFV